MVGLLTDLVKRCNEWKRCKLNDKEEVPVRGTTGNEKRRKERKSCDVGIETH